MCEARRACAWKLVCVCEDRRWWSFVCVDVLMCVCVLVRGNSDVGDVGGVVWSTMRCAVCCCVLCVGVCCVLVCVVCCVLMC